MKKINQSTIKRITFLAIALIVVACGGKNEESLQALIESGDLNAIRGKKKELSEKQKALEEDILSLDSVIFASIEDRNLPLVTILQTTPQVFNHFVELQGDVSTKQNVLIYPEMSGTLLEVKVKEGAKVTKGQELAIIDDGGMQSQLSQMQTQLALAKTTFERQANLWENNIGSEIQYLQAKTNYEAQKNACDQMKKQLAKFTIVAPFSGIIDDVIKDKGTVVAPGPGSEVFRIVNLSDMYIEVSVPETYLTTITQGKEVKVFFPVINETIESSIRETGNFINPDNRSFTAEVPVSNRNGFVKPNLTAKVQINDYTNQSAILLPLSVISENAEGEQYVFVASDVNNSKGKAHKKVVETGKSQGDYIEILSGIEPGSKVIIEGARSVKDGQKIQILTQES